MKTTLIILFTLISYFQGCKKAEEFPVSEGKCYLEISNTYRENYFGTFMYVHLVDKNTREALVMYEVNPQSLMISYEPILSHSYEYVELECAKNLSKYTKLYTNMINEISDKVSDEHMEQLGVIFEKYAGKKIND